MRSFAELGRWEAALTRMVGRQLEFTQLCTFLAGCRSGPSVLVIEGEPGIGKSIVFEEALAVAAARMRLLQVRCVEAETGLAYAGLADLLGAWMPAVLAALSGPQRRALEITLMGADAGPDMVEQHVMGRATVAALECLAAEMPVVVAIDDVQWLDPASGRVLSFAVRRLGNAPVSVLATRRLSSGVVNGSLPLGLDDAMPALRPQRLVLGPMPAPAVEAMLGERFGGRLPRRSLSGVVAVAAGNPLYAMELAAARTLPQRSVDQPGPLPPRLEQLLADRVGRLPAAATEPLAAVASLAAPTVAMVAAALGEGAKAGLDSALDAGVLQVEEGRLWFAHPLLGIAALTRLPPSTRRALHARLAAVAADPEERARHLVFAADGPDAAVAAAVEQGAELARARGAPQAAAELAEAAVRLTPREQHDDARRRRIAAGYHWVTAGEAGRGRALLAAALEDAPAGPVRAELRWRLGMVCRLDDDTSQAVALLEAALAEADQPALQATIARKLASLYGWQGRMSDALQHTNAALSWAEHADDPRVLLESLMNHVMIMLLHGIAIPGDALRRIVELSRTTGPFAAHEDPEALRAFVAFVHGDLNAAATGLRQVLQRAEEQGDEFGIASVANLLAQVELAAGRWATARRLADEVADKARTVRVALMQAPALYVTALVHAHLGAVDIARAAAEELIESAERNDAPPLWCWGQAVLGFLALSCGDAHTAHTHLGPLCDRLNQVGLREPVQVHLAWSDIDALVELGKLDKAEALAADLHQRGQTLDRPFALATAARGRGLICAARGDFTAAQAEFNHTLAEHDRLGWPFERARTLLALGTVLRRNKQKRAARETLHQAQAIFDGLGARLWSTKTTAELARIGGRPPSAGSLTATEHRVAELAADGHTNRQVAAQLFLSTKTVAAHLTSVYAKLGVRSRTELARHFHDPTHSAARRTTP
jgi:DNA-binding CsgD family transcriptional regulator